jgi:calcium permeable stress-gated cation channel
MIFVITTFSLFYFTYLHNFLYVYEFTTDTGGLAFPRALYQTMTGLYFAEVCLIGLFFLNSDARAQGFVMVFVLLITVLFHVKLAQYFDPLITYLPVDIQEELASQVREQKLDDGQRLDAEREFQERQESKSGFGDILSIPEAESCTVDASSSSEAPPQVDRLESLESSTPINDNKDLDDSKAYAAGDSEPRRHLSILQRARQINEKIYIPGLTKRHENDEDEDNNVDTSLARKFAYELTHEELTAIAFQHKALRERPPILWIPEDELGIAEDEIRRTKLESGGEIEMTCKGAKLDNRGKTVWLQNPPDYVHIPTI